MDRAKRASLFFKIASAQPGSTPYTNHRPIHVGRRFVGQTLAQVLGTTLTYRDAPQKIVAHTKTGEILVDGKSVKPDRIMVGGNRITITQHNYSEPAIEPRIQIIHEDNSFLVIDKPSPMPVHPCGRFNKNSFLKIAQSAWPDLDLFPVHRLDANTTGVLLFAKKKTVARHIQLAFERQTIKKIYVAKVRGHPTKDFFEVNVPINKAPSIAGTRETSRDGQRAKTKVRVLARHPDNTSLLEVSPITGRTNQIRVHLHLQGHSIIGDPGYGAEYRRDAPLTSTQERLYLHALSLGVPHPETGLRAIFTAPPPAWFGNWTEPKTDAEHRSCEV